MSFTEPPHSWYAAMEYQDYLVAPRDVAYVASETYRSGPERMFHELGVRPNRGYVSVGTSYHSSLSFSLLPRGGYSPNQRMQPRRSP